MAMLGFVFFDLLYVAITINYCSQCQLLKYYIENVIDKVQNKKYKSLDRACQVGRLGNISSYVLCIEVTIKC